MPTLAVDLYPAWVDGPDGRVKECRLWITDGGRAVIHRRSGRTVELHADVQTDDFTVESGRKITFTVDGQGWQVIKSGGCGCGSPLKRLNVGDYQW